MFGDESFGLLAPSVKHIVYAFSLYYLVLFTYRLLFHPLRNYPGPPLAKVTNAYAGFHALLKELHLTTYQGHLKHGPVYRAGPNKLVFNTITSVEGTRLPFVFEKRPVDMKPLLLIPCPDIYRNDRVTKARVYLLTMQPNGVESIFQCLDRERHRSKRKLIQKALSDRAVHCFEPTIKEQVHVFLGQLLVASQEPTSSAANMTERCKRLSLDIIGLLAFGFPLRTQTDDTYRFMIKGMAARIFRGNSLMQFPALKNRFLDSVLHALTRKGRTAYHEVLERMISTRLAMDKDSKVDFYSFIADQVQTGEPDSVRLTELWSEAVFFFPAGGDTTATGLAALFFYLSRYPEAYHKLADEIRTTFADADEIGGPKLSDCRYLRACFDEALRLSPPVSGTLWCELAEGERQRGGPLVVDGHVIPSDTMVGVNIYSLQHNEAYFPDPFVFKPERWLDNNHTAALETSAAFLAFATGSRGCAGKSMAYLEAGLVVASTLWYFDFDTAPGSEGAAGSGKPGNGLGRQREKEFQLYDNFTASHDGPNLAFRTRGDYWREL